MIKKNNKHSSHSVKALGRPAYDLLRMFKILIISKLYGYSDPEVETMLYGNLFYRRFFGLSAIDEEGKSP